MGSSNFLLNLPLNLKVSNTLKKKTKFRNLIILYKNFDRQTVSLICHVCVYIKTVDILESVLGTIR